MWILCDRIGSSFFCIRWRSVPDGCQTIKLPSRIHCRSWSRFRNHQSMPVPSGKMGNGRTPCFVRNKYALSVVGRNHQLPSIDDDFDQEPFWSNVLKKSFWALKSLSRFLVEQPSQLKYIEWPSFQSTLKTATLTLLLVGLLIIALSSVDSALYYILALLSRRRA
ncbi:uncharacterized protein [Coffea arabica]|uniref:Uncharacterized protein isoform X3 n=1 Tax=Coffea arabica TaxID=13443 RepID=A0A6P6U6G0_COFAR|nr:uncharacterized protein LOC113708041 isoform X2 [Coffea arabica]